MINNENEVSTNIIIDCRELFLDLRNPTNKHNHRQENQVADLLAKKGAQQEKIGVLLYENQPHLLHVNLLKQTKVLIVLLI